MLMLARLDLRETARPHCRPQFQSDLWPSVFRAGPTALPSTLEPPPDVPHSRPEVRTARPRDPTERCGGRLRTNSLRLRCSFLCVWAFAIRRDCPASRPCNEALTPPFQAAALHSLRSRTRPHEDQSGSDPACWPLRCVPFAIPGRPMAVGLFVDLKRCDHTYFTFVF